MKKSLRSNPITSNPLALKKSKGVRGVVVGDKLSRSAPLKEKDLQKLCESFLEAKRIRYIRVPDSLWAFVMTSKVAPVWLKAFCSKFLAGMPDLVILQGEKALHVELKTKSGKVSQKQIEWAKTCKVHVIRDFESFKEVVIEWEKL